MKIDINKNPKSSKTLMFPNIFESITDSKGLIVLGVSEHSGTVLAPGKSTWTVGAACEAWVPFSDTKTWKPFVGTITLTGE